MSKDTVQRGFQMSFSQQNGFEPLPSPLSIGEITNQLRLELYDVLEKEFHGGSWDLRKGKKAADWEKILGDLWVQMFRSPRTIGVQAQCLQQCQKVIFYHDFHEVFTLIQDLAIRIGDEQPTFQQGINAALSRNQAPYVLHKSSEEKWMIIQTGAEVERDNALQCLSDLRDPAFEKARRHFEKAGAHLTKGEFPEAAGQSAKALEACLKKLVDKPDSTGGEALGLYAKKFNVPVPIKESIQGMWNYRNKAEDVGHSGREQSSCPPPNKWEAQVVYNTIAGNITYLINTARSQEHTC